MAITLEIFEDSGPVISGRGTTRQSVNNLGWKNSGLDETYSHTDYPIIRPDLDDVATLEYSYTKYYYLKISGTYPNAARVRLQFQGDIATPRGGYTTTDGVKMYYNLTNIYAAPTKTIMTGTWHDFGNSPILTPFLSTVGPEVATGYVNKLVTDTVYYSNYIVTQLYVTEDVWTKYGNIGGVDLKFWLDEYETTDI